MTTIRKQMLFVLAFLYLSAGEPVQPILRVAINEVMYQTYRNDSRRTAQTPLVGSPSYAFTINMTFGSNVPQIVCTSLKRSMRSLTFQNRNHPLLLLPLCPM